MASLLLKGLLFAALAVTAGPVLCQPQQPLTITGAARDLSSGEPLYTETYQCDQAGTRCTVLYRDISGTDIALKKLDYRLNPLAPVVELNDYRQSQHIVIQQTDTENLVVDAGFDNYIRHHWQSFLQNQSLNFAFLVAGRDSPLPMVARRMPEPSCSSNELCLQVKLDSWLLALLTDPIELTYSLDSRRLLRYRGISNIASAGGSSQQVDIRYSYQVEPIVERTADVAAAATPAALEYSGPR